MDLITTDPTALAGRGMIRAYSGLTGAPIWTANGTQDAVSSPVGLGEAFGSALAFADWDGDGAMDVAVGRPYYCVDCTGAPGGNLVGNISILRGADGTLLSEIAPTPTLAQNAMGGNIISFGQRLAGGADLTGDGIHDLVTSASGYAPIAVGAGTGAVFVVDAALGLVSQTLEGLIPGEFFGGLGVPEGAGGVALVNGPAASARLIVGSHFSYQGSTVAPLGSVRVYEQGTFATLSEVFGTLPWAQLGTHIDGGVDLSGDGVADYIASRWPASQLPPSWSGVAETFSVDVYSGSDLSLLWTAPPTTLPTLSYVGLHSARVTGDVTGDGKGEVLLTWSANGLFHVQSFSVPSAAPVFSWTYYVSPADPLWVAHRGEPIGDVNRDGLDDIAVLHVGTNVISPVPANTDQLEVWLRRNLEVGASGIVTIGQSTLLQATTPSHVGSPVVFLFSGSTAPGISLGDFTIPLVPDGLFWGSLSANLVTFVAGNGIGSLALYVPNDLSLVGAGLWASGVVVDGNAPFGIGTVLTPRQVSIQ